jgi:hypothetical protein
MTSGPCPWGLVSRRLREPSFHQPWQVYNRVDSGVNTYIYNRIVHGVIYMNFHEAVDALCASLDHEDVAKALGVSVQTVRQARLRQGSDAFRAPPKNWKAAITRLAKARVSYYRKLVEKMKH